ncbi:MAG: alkaline phosphatase family protein [Chloroflexota bacterium]|nr:alkaline phosphatase family protein [Chloroflexota bacterium]
MTDIVTQNLDRIRHQENDRLHLDETMTLPFYDGLSLANIPGTITELLGAPAFGRGPLDSSILSGLDVPYKKVVFLLVDALGYTLLEKMMASDPDLVWAKLRQSGVYSPITSVCPSTTASALTTLWTGVPPAEHGIIGYEMWAKEFGTIINNILHSPAAARGDVGGLSRAGFDPHEFVDAPLLGPHLRAAGITPTTFIHYSIAHSGLSVMQMKDVDLAPYVDEADLAVSLADFLNGRAGERDYVYVYYSDVDTLMHRFNASDQRVTLQFSAFSDLFEQACLDRLSPEVRDETILLLAADHGSMPTPIDHRYDLVNHPELLSNLVMNPTCEHRLAFFYLKPGAENEVRDYIERTWPGEFLLLNSKEALDAGLFGEPPFKGQTPDRIGDLIAVAKGQAYFWWAPTLNHMHGRHGGLSRQEMLVPFLAVPLGNLS